MVAPKFEKLASVSSPLVAATQMMFSQRVVARERPGAVVVGARVAGGGHELRVRVAGDHGALGVGRRVGAEREVDDLRAAVGRVLHAVDDVLERPRAAVVEHADREQRDRPHDARHAGAVVAARARGARDVGAVALAVVGVVVAGDAAAAISSAAAGEVPAVQVVDQAVAVVVAVVVRLARVRVEVRREVRVARVHPGVDHRDDHPRVAGGDVPGLGRVDVAVGGGRQPRGAQLLAVHGLAGVVEAPQAREERVVGNRERAADEVRLGEGDVVVGLQGPHGLGDRDARGGVDDLGSAQAHRAFARHVGDLSRVEALGGARARLVAHDHLAGVACRGGRGKPENHGKCRQHTLYAARPSRSSDPCGYMQKDVILTPEGLQNLKQELEHLQTENVARSPSASRKRANSATSPRTRSTTTPRTTRPCSSSGSRSSRTGCGRRRSSTRPTSSTDQVRVGSEVHVKDEKRQVAEVHDRRGDGGQARRRPVERVAGRQGAARPQEGRHGRGRAAQRQASAT